MTYYYLEVRFDEPSELLDSVYPVRVYKAFIEAMQEAIESHNFSKYWEKGSPRPPTMQLRFKTSNPRLVLKIAKRVCTQLVADHQITSCSDQLVEWKEPEFVQRAHDLGTKLALHFVSYILGSRSIRTIKAEAGLVHYSLHS
jgi:hypothetical protein